jgi:hypothetical protein
MTNRHSGSRGGISTVVNATYERPESFFFFFP